MLHLENNRHHLEPYKLQNLRTDFPSQVLDYHEANSAIKTLRADIENMSSR
jgi:hypothetical protein